MWCFLSSPAGYLFLAWLALLGALFAIARPERSRSPVLDIDQQFSWKWLAPPPRELRLLMRQSARKKGFAWDVLASCTAEFNARFGEEIKRIGSSS